MKREYWKECSGCCWMKRAGEIIWTCQVKRCPLNRYFFGHSDHRENGNGLTDKTSFT